MNIGVIGYGIVGKAVAAGFRRKCRIFISDPGYPRMSRPIGELVRYCRFIFVAVPTPMRRPTGGPIDTRIIDETMASISAQADKLNKHPIIIIKSTLIPSRLSHYGNVYSRLRIVLNPEYLTERRPRHDFINAPLMVLGGAKADTDAVRRLYRRWSSCKPCPVGCCDLVGAAILKYMANCFLALKVTFMNECCELVRRSGTTSSWQDLARILHFDPRLGNSHYQVPGPDGRFGWGGKCFPKDVSAFIHYAEELGHQLRLLRQAWSLNKQQRADSH